MKKKSIVLIGGGGHCKSCIDVVEQEKALIIEGIIELPESKIKSVLGYPVIGSDADIVTFVNDYQNFLITIGQIRSPAKRVELFNTIVSNQGIFPVIISPNAYVSPHSVIGDGTIIMHNAVINAGAIVGKNCIINTHALIEHDAVIEDHCHISTGAVINGGTRVAKQSFVGSLAVAKENIAIGRNSIIGAGVGVMGDVPPNTFLTK